MKSLKRITVTVARSTSDSKSIVKTLVNGIHVLTIETYKENFRTFRKGQYSKTPDRVKIASKSTWNREGLIQLFGAEVVEQIDWSFRPSKSTKIFRNFYPDASTGFAGKALNTREVREAIMAYIAPIACFPTESKENLERNAGLTDEQLSEFRAEAEIS